MREVSMTITVERHTSEVHVSDADSGDNPLKRLEAEFLASVSQDYPNFKSSTWDFKPTDFNGMDSPISDFANSPAAMNEYKENQKKITEDRNKNYTTSMTLLESILRTVKPKSSTQDLKFDEMKKVHSANQELLMLKHEAFKNKTLADFAQQKMDAEISERGLDSVEKVTEALNDQSRGGLYDTTVQFDAAVKETIEVTGKMESILQENPSLSDSAKEGAFQSIDELKANMDKMMKSVMESASALVNSLCGLFSGSKSNNMKAGG